MNSYYLWEGDFMIKKQKMINKLILWLFFLCLAFPAMVFADFYKWTDKEGKTHFTDNYLSIPKEYQNQVEERKSSSPITEKEKQKKPEEPPQIIDEEEAESPEKNTQEEKDQKISILDKVVPTAGVDGNMVFFGRIKNNSKDLLQSVEIVFAIEGREGKVLEIAKSSIKGELEGALKEGETGSFEVKTKIPFNTVVTYKYNVRWKSFVN